MTYSTNTNSSTDTYISRINGIHNITYIMYQIPLFVTEPKYKNILRSNNVITY